MEICETVSRFLPIVSQIHDTTRVSWTHIKQSKRSLQELAGYSQITHDY